MIRIVLLTGKGVINVNDRERAIILTSNLIEYYKSMNTIIEQYDSITVEAVKSVFDFSISNLMYLKQILEGKK